MLPSRRSRTLAAAALAGVAGTLSSAAQAAWLSLSAAGDDVFVCTPWLYRRDVGLTSARPMADRITAGESKYFNLGALPASDRELSPDFFWLTLECEAQKPTAHDLAASGGSYSIELKRDDPLWLVFDEAISSPLLEPPHDHATVHFTLASTGHTRYAIRIIEAWVTRADGSRLDYDLGGAPYCFTPTGAVHPSSFPLGLGYRVRGKGEDS